MAGIPYVADPLQMLWQFQQDQARTNLINNQSQLANVQAQHMKQNMAIEAENQRALHEYRNQAMIQGLMGNASQFAPNPSYQAASAAPQEAAPESFVGSSLQGMLGLPGAPLQTYTLPRTASIAQDETKDPNVKMLREIDSGIAEARANIAQSRYLAQKYAGIQGVDIPKESTWVTRLNDLTNKKVEIAKEQVAQNAKNAEQAANVLRDVDSTEGLRTGLNFVRSTFGAPAAEEIIRTLPLDQAGQPMWNDATKQAIAPYVSRYTTMAQKATQEHNALTLERQTQRDAQLAANEDTQRRLQLMAIQHADLRASAAQAGANQRAKDRLDALEKGLGFREEREQTRIETQGNAALQKDPTVSNLDRYEKAFNAAKNVVENINNNAWLKSRNVSEPAADAMMQEYRNAVQNFRANSGGKWSVEDQKKYASTMEKLNSFVQTIGQGKKPDTRVMQDVAGEINRMYQEQNASALKATLRQREIVYNQGGDPNNVQSRASVDRAIASGKAKSWTDPDTGTQYLRFGPGKDDAFPVYTAPKPKRPRAGAAVLRDLVGGDEVVTTE